MKYFIDRDNKVAAYLQLYLALREDIVSGLYPYGTRLPSKRTLSSELALSTVTVEHAYALLCDEGYAEARQRSGYFSVFRTGDGFAEPSGAPVLPTPSSPLSSPSDFPFSVLARTMRSVIGDFGESILAKSPNKGLPAFRHGIAEYLSRSRGIHVNEEQIVIGSGSEYLYGLAVALLGRERIFGIESPSYMQIAKVYKASDVRYVSLPLGADGITSEALKATEASVLHISPYRSFPSGVSASASKRHEYLEWAKKEGRYIIEDDFESEFSLSRKHEETLFSHSGGENIIYLNSFSVTVSPAFRTAYMVLSEGLLERFEEKLGFYSCTVPVFEQLVLTRLIDGGDFERHINRVRRKKRKEARL